MPAEDVADLSFIDRAAAAKEPAVQERAAQERGEGS
jgi:hypothetical protein